MGYCTDYTLSVYGAQKGKDGSILMTADFSKILEDLIDAEIQKMNMFTDGNIQDSYYGNGTWYDHEEDMRLLSAKFPDNVFWLSGHGDDPEDMWQKFFVAGRMQKCYAQIVYDDFDAGKLDEAGSVDVAAGRYSYEE